MLKLPYAGGNSNKFSSILRKYCKCKITEQSTNMEADRVEVHVFKLDVSMTLGCLPTALQKQTVTHLPINNTTEKPLSAQQSQYITESKTRSRLRLRPHYLTATIHSNWWTLCTCQAASCQSMQVKSCHIRPHQQLININSIIYLSLIHIWRCRRRG